MSQKVILFSKGELELIHVTWKRWQKVTTLLLLQTSHREDWLGRQWSQKERGQSPAWPPGWTRGSQEDGQPAGQGAKLESSLQYWRSHPGLSEIQPFLQQVWRLKCQPWAVCLVVSHGNPLVPIQINIFFSGFGGVYHMACHPAEGWHISMSVL